MTIKLKSIVNHKKKIVEATPATKIAKSSLNTLSGHKNKNENKEKKINKTHKTTSS